MSDSLRPHGLYRPLGSTVHGILQATIPEWVAIPFSRESSRPRDRTRVSVLQALYRLSHSEAQGGPFLRSTAPVPPAHQWRHGFAPFSALLHIQSLKERPCHLWIPKMCPSVAPLLFSCRGPLLMAQCQKVEVKRAHVRACGVRVRLWGSRWGRGKGGAEKDPDDGRDWEQEEKGTTEDEMARWHHRLDGNEFE